jgi:hypothetical protein
MGPDRVPAVAQSLLIGIPVLRDDRRDPVRMLYCVPEAGRRAVLEDKDGIATEADHLGEAVDHRCDLVEAIAAARHVRVAESPQVWRDGVKAIGEERDEVAKHVVASSPLEL